MRRHLPAQPAVAHVVDRPEGMAAFAHDDFFDLQAEGGFEVRALDPAHQFVVAGEHGHVAVVPADGGRHGPVDTGHVHDDGRLVDQLGLKFGFGGDDRVHDVGALLFQRDPQGGNFGLGLFFLPLEGVRPFVAFDPHLVHGAPNGCGPCPGGTSGVTPRRWMMRRTTLMM